LSLLLDENLSPRLTFRLASLLRGLIHVRDVGLKQAGDEEIWDWARENSHAVITADRILRHDEVHRFLERIEPRQAH
jgi:predicted nuclease of predicted toxin-antitoxin system